jgi:hypothetical protein
MDCFDFMVRKILTQAPVETFIDKDPHVSSEREEALGCSLNECDDLLASNSGKSGEKLVYCFSSFKIIQQVLDRDSCAGKNRSATQNIRI